MRHYFSTQLVAHFFFGDEHKSYRLWGHINKGSICVTMVENWNSLKLTNKAYMNMNQLIALDFVLSLRAALPKAIPGRAKLQLSNVIREQCKRIMDLPDGGWQVGSYKIVVVKPRGSQTWIVSAGSRFETFINTQTAMSRVIIYRGSNLIKKLKKIRRKDYVYAQIRDDIRYWGIRTPAERTFATSWRKIV